MDEHKFYSYYAIPLLKELKEKVDSDSDWGICNSFFNIFEIVVENGKQCLENEATYGLNTPGYGSSVSIYCPLIDFLDTSFNSYIVDVYFSELVEQDEVVDESVSKSVPITELLNQLNEYLGKKQDKSRAPGSSAQYWYGVPIKYCMNDDLFYNLLKKLGIVKRIVGCYKLFVREIKNLENQYLTG